MKYSFIADDVKLGKNVKIFSFANLYGCEVGDETKFGTFVEILKDYKIGCIRTISSRPWVIISHFSFIKISD